MLPKMDRRPARSSLGKRGRAQRCAAFRAVCKRAIRTFRPEQPDPRWRSYHFLAEPAQ